MPKKTDLDQYLSSYGSFNDWLIKRRYHKLQQFFQGDTCLEMGIAEGTGIEDLLAHFDKVTVVDGSKAAIDKIKKQFTSPKLHVIQSYFEDMDFGNERFDTIMMAHILEHVDDPIKVLKHAKTFLKPNGVFIIDVPNGNSLHRQVGVKMGLLKEKTELNEADLSIGHQRVYTPETFKQDVQKSGLKIVKFGGMFIKILSNSQTEAVINEQQLEALFLVGEDNPNIAAEIFIIAKLS